MLDLLTVSTEALAYLGDNVIELCVRSLLVKAGISHSAELNRTALDFVRAGSQAEAIKRLLPILTEEETAIFKRGRNIGHTKTPKSATPAQYRAATGMEALFGWLYLSGKSERIDELFSEAYKDLINNITERNK